MVIFCEESRKIWLYNRRSYVPFSGRSVVFCAKTSELIRQKKTIYSNKKINFSLFFIKLKIFLK
ncbi:MAG: hypothetical protein EAZ97_03225 [Bacteroidetes bacterium]|nr:MAG: hypothetical protein EAZ97_03225 [Bacteroidota bacterium]